MELEKIDMNALPDDVKNNPELMKAIRLTNVLTDVIKDNRDSLEVKFWALATAHFSMLAGIMDDGEGKDLIDRTFDHLRDTLDNHGIDYSDTELDKGKASQKHVRFNLNDSDYADEVTKEDGEENPQLVELVHRIVSIMGDRYYDMETVYEAALTIFGNVSAGYIKHNKYSPTLFVLKILSQLDGIWEKQDLHMNGVIMPIGENKED